MANTRGRDDSEALHAVCFDRRDYAGAVSRAVIVCIDLAVVIVVSFGVLFVIAAVWLIRHPKSDLPPVVIWIPLIVAYFYLTIIARSRIRSLGYILTGMRIADIRGGRPSLLQMTIRLVPLLPVPWSFLFDLGWIMDEPPKADSAGQVGRHVRRSPGSQTDWHSPCPVQADRVLRVVLHLPRDRRRKQEGARREPERAAAVIAFSHSFVLFGYPLAHPFRLSSWRADWVAVPELASAGPLSGTTHRQAAGFGIPINPCKFAIYRL